MEPYWSTVNMPSNILLEKTDFAFPSRYQLQIVPWLLLEICDQFFSVLGYLFFWFEPEQVSGPPSLYLWVIWPQSCCVWRCCFLSMHHLWLLQSFCILFYMISEPFGKGLDKDIPFRAASLDFLILHSVQFWVSVLITIFLKKNPLWWEWLILYSMGTAQCHEESFYCLFL